MTKPLWKNENIINKTCSCLRFKNLQRKVRKVTNKSFVKQTMLSQKLHWLHPIIAISFEWSSEESFEVKDKAHSNIGENLYSFQKTKPTFAQWVQQD